eukprot:m.137072 g.137072  ORF g.137072 m.137072 type:complete len:269 (-) comp16040_c0_seq3:377-1183(-)
MVYEGPASKLDLQCLRGSRWVLGYDWQTAVPCDEPVCESVLTINSFLLYIAVQKDETLDGELFVGRGKFSATVSIVKTSGTDRWKQVTYMVFDSPSRGDDPFESRMQAIQSWHQSSQLDHVTVVLHTLCQGVKHVQTELKRVTETLGGEGLMLRQPKSKYQAGRNYTLLKVKQFHDAEAIVRGYSAGKGKHKGKVGALEVEMASGKSFKVGSGMSDHDRDHPPAIGAIVTYRFQELTDDGIPRFPTFVGERVDMTAPKDAVIVNATKT